MSTLVSFRRNSRTASDARRRSDWRPAETHHLAPEIMAEEMGLTARFRSSREAAHDLLRDEMYNSDRYSRITNNFMRIHNVKHVQGEWMLLFANADEYGACMETNHETSDPQWTDDKPLCRPHLLESGGGETMAVWRDIKAMPGRFGGLWDKKSSAAEIRPHKDYRVTRVLFDQQQDRWVAYYDTSGLQYGEWIVTGDSIEKLKTRLQEVYESGRASGTSWHTVALECSPKREWLMVMRGFRTSVGGRDVIRKESVEFLPTNDNTAADVVRKAAKLAANDSYYRLRHLASDGKNTVMVAQSSKAFKSYSEVLHVVDSPEELRELVHGYLEKSSTVDEHWEVGLAVDLQKPNINNDEEHKAHKAREKLLEDKLSKALAQSAQLKEQMRSDKLSMEKELNSAKRELRALKSKPPEDAMFDKLRTSVREAVEDVGSIGSQSDRRKSFKNLKMQLHPDKHPSAFSWSFTEIFKMLPGQATEQATSGNSKQGASSDQNGHRHKRRRDN